jgi:hypothetical protein
MLPTQLGAYCWVNKQAQEAYILTKKKIFEVPTGVTMKSTVFWDVTLCRQVEIHQCYGRTYCLNLWG